MGTRVRYGVMGDRMARGDEITCAPSCRSVATWTIKFFYMDGKEARRPVVCCNRHLSDRQSYWKERDRNSHGVTQVVEPFQDQTQPPPGKTNAGRRKAGR
ncbi:MAG TPA: hypothetical protein VE326_11280 [Candidatus Binatia bacterium]|nr:hypothetical protein [Candidatus Binatia bacterium]